MTTAPNLPRHELVNTPNVKGIKVNGWTITSRKDTILNSAEIDRLSNELGFPLPEMIFGKNNVTLENAHGFRLTFDTADALRLVDSTNRSGEAIKVSYSEEWTKRSLNHQESIKDVVKPYDWTYSTEYAGTLVSPVLPDRTFETTTQRINIDKLRRPEPIMFYDDNILYEDELGDNGTAVLNVKVRVMPSCFFLLQRFFLRVDEVLFRVNETRVYHEFDQGYLLREYSTREEHYDCIRAKLRPTKPLDISPLTDANWVSAQLPAPKTGALRTEKVDIEPPVYEETSVEVNAKEDGFVVD